jgi:hypothetical protein
MSLDWTGGREVVAETAGDARSSWEVLIVPPPQRPAGAIEPVHRAVGEQPQQYTLRTSLSTASGRRIAASRSALPRSTTRACSTGPDPPDSPGRTTRSADTARPCHLRSRRRAGGRGCLRRDVTSRDWAIRISADPSRSAQTVATCVDGRPEGLGNEPIVQRLHGGPRPGDERSNPTPRGVVHVARTDRPWPARPRGQAAGCAGQPRWWPSWLSPRRLRPTR